MSYDSILLTCAWVIGLIGRNSVLTPDWLPLRATEQWNLGCCSAEGTQFTAFCVVLLLLEWMWQDATPLWD